MFFLIQEGGCNSEPFIVLSGLYSETRIHWSGTFGTENMWSV